MRGLIKYTHNTYNRRTQKIPSEDTLFYFRKRWRTAVSMPANDGAFWVRAHTFVIDEGVTNLSNSRSDSGLTARLTVDQQQKRW